MNFLSDIKIVFVQNEPSGKNIQEEAVIQDAEPLKISFGDSTWRTPELTAGFFGSTSRFKYSRSSLETPTPEQPTVSYTEKIQHVLQKVTGTQQAAMKHGAFTAMKKPPLKRAAVAGTQPPMKRATIAGTKPPLSNHELQDMLPPKKHPHQEGSAATNNDLPPQQPPSQQNKDGSEVHIRKKIGLEMEWTAGYKRDPLLHISVVTPPCPIRPGLNETPQNLRTYSHVSKMYTMSS